MSESSLDPVAVSARLAMLSRLYRPMTLAEAESRERVPVEVDLSPQTVSRRLEELSALLRLTRWLQSR